ncbi:MAG: PQQ-dependent sugar dehydrogenase [Anaerolineae bacterium]
MLLRRRLPLFLVSVILVMLLVGCGQPAQTATVALTATESAAASQPSPIPAAPTSAPTAATPASPTSPPTLPPQTDSPSVPPPTSTEPAAATATISPTATQPPTPVPTAGPADPTQVRLELETVVSNLDRPLGIVHAGDGSGRLFILEKPGRIRILRSDALEDRPFLDLTDRVGSSGSEQGLLGLAFHPNYADNGRLFTNYTDRNGDTVISQFLVSDDPDRAEPGSEQVLLTLDQPAANHNGGHLAFGPDGYLYIGTGDGGAAGDQFGNGQNARTLLGAMLRLDIDSAQPYAIPGDNPFVGDDAARDELWAIGLRNPWRYSFDRLTGDLYIADVGQNTYEEVNRQPASSAGGENYGWPIMEGLHCFPADGACDQSGLVLPVHEYDHSQGCSVTGGYVYRGQRYPVLQGIYLFGDYCSGIIWGMAAAGGDSWRTAKLLQTDARISSFGEDEAGELYLVDIAGGGLSRLTATPAE